MGKAENEIEKYLCSKIMDLGGIPYKFKSPSRNHVPDRICMMPYGVTILVECKAPKGTLSPGQVNEIKRLHLRGHFVVVVSTKEEVDTIILAIKEAVRGRIQRDAGAGANVKHKPEETDTKAERG